MMKWILFLFFFVHVFHSNAEARLASIVFRSDANAADSILLVQDSIPRQPRVIPYFTLLKRLKQKRQQLKLTMIANQIDFQKVQLEFERQLIQEILPYWYGTQWDFNGYTNRPNQGKIACGYFVSTTLLHSGLPIDRYKLAQKAPVDEARMLAYGQEVIDVNDFDSLMMLMQDSSTKNGIYFIGLDQNHVGFLLKRKQIWFIHSAYNEPAVVRIEWAFNSAILRSFSRFYLVGLTTNEKFLAAWLNAS